MPIPKRLVTLRHLNTSLAGIQLEPKYARHLADGRLERYAERLNRDGLGWWCEFETDKLARHLAVLRETAVPLPPRLGFLDEIIDRSLSQAGYLGWFEHFLSDQDTEAATVAVAAALHDIWLSGREFQRAAAWFERGEQILAAEPGDLARAALLGHIGVMQLMGEVDLHPARATFAACRKAADMAGSLPIRLFQATFEAHALLWSGEFATAEVLLTDASALACHPPTPHLAGLYLRASLCLYLTLRGDAEAARRLLREDIRQFEFARLSALPWLGVLSALLHADAAQGNEVAVGTLGGRMRKRLVAPEKTYYHVMLHHALGVADLLLGRPSLALAHARLARTLWKPGSSAVARHLPVLLEVQARVDMGDHDRALALADAWMGHWQEAGLAGIASTARVEMAVVYQRQGRPEQACAALEQARALLPPGESLVPFYRSTDYLAQLLVPAPVDGTTLACSRQPVAIHALGELRLRLATRQLRDRHWRGERAKTLIKALLVLGGRNVPAGTLAHLLWPDAEDEQARGNLKVALWRLRRLGTEQGEPPLPWLLSHNGQISLAPEVVSVDALEFLETAEAALRQRPPDRQALLAALDRYEADFLAGDDSERWIVDHRQRLRDLYLTAARALATHADTRETLEPAIAHLERGHHLDPLDERVVTSLMAAYLRLGYPGKALTCFQATEAALARELGIQPGTAMLALAERARGTR
jgi:DNA-binding SARP family transcriptional activator